MFHLPSTFVIAADQRECLLLDLRMIRTSPIRHLLRNPALIIRSTAAGFGYESRVAIYQL